MPSKAKKKSVQNFYIQEMHPKPIFPTSANQLLQLDF